MIVNGVNKSAILLMLIGSEEAVKVFKYLTLYEIQKIIHCILDIDLVSQKDINGILHDFILQYQNISQCVFFDKNIYINSIKKNFFNKKKSESFLKKIINKKDFFNKIQELQNIPDKNLFDLLKHEHTYVITSILFFLDVKYSSSIISRFKYEKQSEIIFSISQFSGVDEFKMLELSKIIDIILSEYKTISFKKKSLITAVNILNTIDFDKRCKIIHNIFKYNADIGEDILCSTLVFEDFEKFSDDSIMKLIKYIDKNQITIALYYAKKEIKFKFFRCSPSLEKTVMMLEMNKNQHLSDKMIKNTKDLIVLTAKKLLKKKKISIIY